MSDITKKIHSIDPETPSVSKSASAASEASTPLKLKPLPLPSTTATPEVGMPAFVTRRNDITTAYYDDPKSGKGYIWLGVVLALIWMGMGVALLFTRGIDAVQQWNLYDILLAGVVITLPAILIIFLSVALQKLTHLSAKAIRLSDIGAQLLRADDNAASATSNVAQSVRSEINTLDSEVTRMNAKLLQLKTDSETHVKDLGNAAAESVTMSDTIIKNFKAQKLAMDGMSQSLENRLNVISTTLNEKKDALLNTAEQAQALITESAETLDAKLVSMAKMLEDVDIKSQESAKTLESLDLQAQNATQSLSEKVNELDAVTTKIASENETFNTLVNARIAELEQIAELNQMTDEAFSHYIEKSKAVTTDLNDTAQSADKTLTARLADLKTEFAKGHDKSDQNLKALETAASTLLGQFDIKTDALESRLKRLQTSISHLDAHVQNSAETRELSLEIPQHTPNQTTSSRGRNRLHVRPLDVDSAEGHVEKTITQPSESLFAEMPTLGTLSQAENLDYAVPLELENEIDADLVMPSHSANDAYTLQVLDEEELVRPLSETSSSLFGRKKSAQKTKSPWRWRDMLGGFDSNDIDGADTEHHSANFTSNALAPAASLTPTPVTSQSFEDAIASTEIDPDALISDGTILDVATAYMSDATSVGTILNNRLADVAQHIQAKAQSDASFKASAEHYRKGFAQSINPEIMNRDAIRNSLSSTEGRLYLLSLLA